MQRPRDPHLSALPVRSDQRRRGGLHLRVDVANQRDDRQVGDLRERITRVLVRVACTGIEDRPREREAERLVDRLRSAKECWSTCSPDP